MTPTNDEARPGTGAGSKVENPDGGFDTSTIRHHADSPRAIRPATVEEMRRLLGDLDAHQREVSDAYVEGYRDGHDAGWAIGYGHAHQEMGQAWHDVAGRVRPHGAGVTGREAPRSLAEIESLRAEPGGVAYLARLARHGGREYTGGPVSWETGAPLRRTA